MREYLPMIEALFAILASSLVFTYALMAFSHPEVLGQPAGVDTADAMALLIALYMAFRIGVLLGKENNE